MTSEGDRILKIDQGIPNPNIGSGLVISLVLDGDMAEVQSHAFTQNWERFNWLAYQVPLWSSYSYRSDLVLSSHIVSYLLQLVATRNGLIENLFNVRIELNGLHPRLNPKIKVLDAKLAAVEKAQADADTNQEIVVAEET